MATMNTTEGMTREQVQQANTMQGGCNFLRDEINKSLFDGVDLLDKPRTYTAAEVSALVHQCHTRACRTIDAYVVRG